MAGRRTPGCSRLPIGPIPTPHECSGKGSQPSRGTSFYSLDYRPRKSYGPRLRQRQRQSTGRPLGLRTRPRPLLRRPPASSRHPRRLAQAHGRAPTPHLATLTGEGAPGRNVKSDSWPRSPAGSVPPINAKQPSRPHNPSGLHRIRPLKAQAVQRSRPPPLASHSRSIEVLGSAHGRTQRQLCAAGPPSCPARRP